MSIEIVKSLFEFLKFAPRYFIALGIAAAFLLFSSDKMLQKIGILEFTKNYRPWIGIIFIFSLALSLVTFIIEITKWFQKYWRIRVFDKRILQRFYFLTEDEKQILRFYIGMQTKTNILRFDDGVVQGLEAAGIIYKAALSSRVGKLAYNIREIAWYHLNENQWLLEGTTNSWRTDKPEF